MSKTGMFGVKTQDNRTAIINKMKGGTYPVSFVKSGGLKKALFYTEEEAENFILNTGKQGLRVYRTDFGRPVESQDPKLYVPVMTIYGKAYRFYGADFIHVPAWRQVSYHAPAYINTDAVTVSNIDADNIYKILDSIEDEKSL